MKLSWRECRAMNLERTITEYINKLKIGFSVVQWKPIMSMYIHKHDGLNGTYIKLYIIYCSDKYKAKA